MVFSSALFLFIFLPLVFVFYFLCPARFPLIKNLILLVFSLIFYAWGEKSYILIMLFAIGFNHLIGLGIEKQRNKDLNPKPLLFFALFINLSLLGWFKYADFFVNNLNQLLNYFNLNKIPLPQVHLPIGISFFTFHCISYIVDVYRQTASAQRNIVNTALYISIFPQLMAGPILRYNDIAPFLSKRKITASGFEYGIMRFIIGLGKKVILANGIAQFVDYSFGLPKEHLTFGIAWLGMIGYSLQIYFDFSGYSDMAIGLGHMFGFKFLENFSYPYMANSIKDFWRRWHISLSQWFRDYLYIPLGGNRHSKFRTSSNLLIVFILCGFWHGASWTFILWGAYHGLFLSFERGKYAKLLARMPTILCKTYAILIVAFGWVLFRSDDYNLAMNFYSSLFGFNPNATTDAYFNLYYNYEVLFIMLCGMIASNSFAKDCFIAFNNSYPTAARVCLSIFLVFIALCSAASLASGIYNPFIYFRF